MYDNFGNTYDVFLVKCRYIKKFKIVNLPYTKMHSKKKFMSCPRVEVALSCLV